ncbi:MAG: hypothetical protein JO285_10735, partial [Kutzneria sp.]|nr:hypothetical protein [Kutzneria sp.]
MSGDRTLVDLTALPDLFAHRVARAADLVALGIFGGTVHRKCLPGGPWQRLLPGVLVLDSS